MQVPTMAPPRWVAADTQVLTAWLPVPGFGVLPVNAYLIHGVEPTLVDTGLAALREPFLQALGELIDPVALRWIWLTHLDPDHVGNLEAVLAVAPHARVVTNYLGMGKMGLLQLPVDRVFLLNPGQRLDLGDRALLSVAPPVFDAPETAGLFDTRSRALFSADCFGALMQAPADEVADVPPTALAEGMRTWATVDAPWLNMVQPRRHDAALQALRGFEPAIVLGSHLPPARGCLDTLCGHLASAREATPFVGPDQAGLERLMEEAVLPPAPEGEVAP
ncbi:MBL fold metallo-hydrolase [Halomonas organivorans]